VGLLVKTAPTSAMADDDSVFALLPSQTHCCCGERVTMDTCMVVSVSAIMAMSVVGVARTMRIFALKMFDGLTVVTAS
jgi:hypothetical protein